MQTKQYRRATALDVKNGDIVIEHGFRCRASNVRHHTAVSTGRVTARYNLTSEPDATYPDAQPGVYNGACYGGNQSARVLIEVEASPLDEVV